MVIKADPAWQEGERAAVLAGLAKRLGAPYQFGAKWKDGDADPAGGVDCSGLSRWAFSLGGVLLPHGSNAQFEACEKWPGKPVPLVLGFADLHGEDSIVDHVVIGFDQWNVIEARAHQEGKDYGKVITRPYAAWERQRGFLGWYFIPGTIEGHG